MKILSVLLFIASAALLSAAENPAGAPPNLLKNGSFENGMEGWTLFSWDKLGTAVVDHDEMHAGHASVRIEKVVGDDDVLQQNVSLKPSTRYRLSGWIKVKKDAKAAELSASLNVSDATDKPEFVSNTSSWTHVSRDFSTGAKPNLRVGPRLGYHGAKATGTAWFTEISLVELGSAPAGPVAPPEPLVAKVVPSPTAPLISAEIVRTQSANLVFVTTPVGSGSGFIASHAGQTYLITNAHVAAIAKGAVFKTLDGTQLKVGSAGAAVGHDIFRMELAPTAKPLQIMAGVDQNAVIGDEVVVLGNAEGAGVINTINGKIVGVGPNLVEVDAPFQPGNSGSPIIHLKTGQVIGVATYVTIRKYDNATKEAVKEPVVRRFGYRLDSVKSWQPVNWPAFYAQAAEMEGIEKLTEDLVTFIKDLGKEHGLTRGAHTNPVIKNRIDAWLETRAKRLSPRDAAMADQSLLSFLKITCQSDIAAARQRLTYDYFQRELVEQQRERTEIAGVLDKIIQNVRQ